MCIYYTYTDKQREQNRLYFVVIDSCSQVPLLLVEYI